MTTRMNWRHWILGGALFLAGVPFARAEATSHNTAPEGYIALFDGKTLGGWRGRQPNYDPAAEAKLSTEDHAKKQAEWDADRDQNWKVDVDKGEIVSNGKGVHLATEKDYGDFDLWVDWLMVSHNGDSGIYLRSVPQVQIWDPDNKNEVRNGAPKGSGALWNDRDDNPGKWPLVRADKPVGQWNRLHIRMVGSRVWVWMNDKQTVNGQILDNFFHAGQPIRKAGAIELQTHGSEIRFRDIYVKEIDSTQANDDLTKQAGEGFASIFNGKDLTGWGGPVEDYQIVEGSIECKPGKGGTLHTATEYGDFEAIVQFKLPKGGNNGLAIRYPGTGETAYTGMCELQVLDDTDPQYKDLDPRQYCCSIYGVVPAHRGYLRPLGEWNFEHVVIKGHTIHVELNGFVVIDADVTKAPKPYMHDSPHPGLMRTKGSFGFAGHNDPVQFKAIGIKSLD